ncbi:hypothetical protein FNV43_RR15222 [Rhamnella rubrinervis]|uniref:Uncharacterized protein n=1 Tax=Rhamnella rubrinervis TaxID=2594499 RepID=A0A8K0GWL7_9ROSA|nr:hypothetical protein FNV43_RR15222 [Rhamnella rubrinervis]
MSEATQRFAVVTGANKGIGLEIVRQLASNGIKVVLTARDEKRGLEAVEKLKEFGASGQVVFHQLDVADSASVVSLADFIKIQFGKLDILVNNAGVFGSKVDVDALQSQSNTDDGVEARWRKAITETYELAEECLQINYYGAKRTTEALIPFLQLSDSPRIVNVSSSMGKIEKVKNEWAKSVFSGAENLTEEKIDVVVREFLKDFKDGSLESKGWSTFTSSYTVSKAAMNAYTRILASMYPSFRINSVCPGYVKTDMNLNTGILTVEEGAASAVKLALLPNDGPSGLFFIRSEIAVVTGANKGIGLGIVRQLASNGIKVVLTARDEKRGLEAVEKLKEFGASGQVVFHQLDVADSASVVSLADFIKTQFGKLDILVNNAGVGGSKVDADALPSQSNSDVEVEARWRKAITETYELAEECLQINYYGAKRATEALIPFLQLSDSPRIVNVSSSMGKIEKVKNEWAKSVFSEAESLTEEKIDEVVREFLKDFKDGSLESKGWSTFLSSYTVSKAAMNAYTRILANKYPSFRINSVCPGYVKTDINLNTGILTVEEGAASPVKLALLPNDGPSGLFFIRSEVSEF